MTIIIKNKGTLSIDDFKFKCSVGKKGFTEKKIEGDLATPKGKYSLGNIYYRADRVKKPLSKLKSISIKKNMGWCDDVRSKDKYNKLINIKTMLKCEKLFRHDYKYDFFIPIKYNWKNIKLGKGSAIFLHLTKSFKPTAGCIGISEKDFLIILKLINRKTKIQIL